jgi:Flp pilus assembly protein protease CpaA
MLQSLGLILVGFFVIKISITDLKNYYIKNIDLIGLFFSSFLVFHPNFKMGFICLGIYLILYFFTGKKLGFGDVKLSFVVGLGINSPAELLLTLNGSWILGGLWAIASKQTKIAFAPWMLIGAIIPQILLK